jgi:hemerythrin
MADWSPDLTLNHEVLDEQHVQIFRRLAEASQAIGGPAPRVAAALDALADALATHVSTEERIMAEALYPERARHRSAHELFMADFARMRDEVRRHGVTPLAVDWLTRRIPDWLGFHIRVNDLPLGAFLARRRALGTEAREAKDGGRGLS